MEEKLNLYQKLAKIRSISDVVTRDRKGYNYTYADITQILAKITAGMKKYEVSLIPMINPQTATVDPVVLRNTKFDKTGKSYENVVTENQVTAEMTFKWVNDEDPSETIEVPWFIVGSQSDPSQAFGSALTYCTRYFLTSYFQIAQADTDVDTYRTKQKLAAEAEDKEIASEIVGEFDRILKTFLSDNHEKMDEVKKFISQYAKNANYLAIKDPALASKLLNDFNEKYMKEEKE